MFKKVLNVKKISSTFLFLVPEQQVQQGSGLKKRKLDKRKYDAIDRFSARSTLFNVEISHNEKFTIVNKTLTLAQDIDMKNTSFVQVTKKVSEFINEIYLEMTNGMDSEDQIFCAIFHPTLDIPIGISFMSLNDFTTQMLENQIVRVCQSKKTLRFDSQLEIKCKIARVISGSGLDNDFEMLFSAKRSIKRIKSDDNFCGVRALLVAKHYAEKDQPRMNNYRSRNKLEEEVKTVVKTLGLKNEPMGLNEIGKIECYLKHYQVTIYD